VVATHEGLENVADAEAICHDGPECQQREQPRGLLQAPHGIAPLRQLTQEDRERARKVGRKWGIFCVKRALRFLPALWTASAWRLDDGAFVGRRRCRSRARWV
jgi:hypothetical protein